MSLNDPLDPETGGPERPIPQMPPPPPAAGGRSSRRSVLAQLAGVSPAIWLGLGVIATLLIVIAIIATATLVRTINPVAVATVEPTPTRVVPALSVAPGTAVPGQLVAVSGFNLIPNDPVKVFLRDPAKPSEPILQVNNGTVSANGLLSIDFPYPTNERWANLTRADVIVQSASTGAYWTTALGVQPSGSVATVAPSGIGTRLPMATLTPPPQAVTGVPATLASSTLAPFATWTPQPFATWTPLAVTIIAYATPVPATVTPLPATTSVPVVPTAVVATSTPVPVITDWRGEYFNNLTLTGAPVVVRNDVDVKFNWGRNAPDVRVLADNFSARWTRTLNFESKTYRFSAQSDDGVRVWVDGNLIIDEWHAAAPQLHTRDVTLLAGPHAVRIEYYEGVLDAYLIFKIEPIEVFNGWKGEYFDNPFVGGTPRLTRDDAGVAFDWGLAAPAAGLPAERWSARWTRTVNLTAGTYRFTLRADDGVRLVIDGTALISEWHTATGQVYVRDISLTAGPHQFMVEYYQETGGAFVWLTYQPPPIDITRWRSEFYANDRWAGFPTLIRSDERLDFDWKADSPDLLIPSDHFSARFTRSIELPAGQYQFDILVDDGVRFYIDGQLMLDAVHEQAVTPYSLRPILTQGLHEFRIDYVEYAGQARLAWSRTPLSATVTPAPTIVPTLIPPLVNQFTVVPNPVDVGGCVELSWQASGSALYARWLRNRVVVQADLPLTSSARDCLLSPGTILYRLEAYNSVGQSAGREVTITVQTPSSGSVPGTPVITTFVADKTTMAAGQCVTLNWNTSNVTGQVDLLVNGQTIASSVPTSGAAKHCPADTGTKTYQLVIAPLPGGAPTTAMVVVQVTSP